MSEQNNTKWLLLIHQIPPKPDYFRVKIWRRLQKVGAVAIKQSVYVLPSNGQAYEDLHWIVKEITAGGGTASLSKTVFLEGITNREIESLFQDARNVEYEKIIKDTWKFIQSLTENANHSSSTALKKKHELSRIKSRFAEIAAIDFFRASGREAAEGILAKCDTLLRKAEKKPSAAIRNLKKIRGRTWVTRQGIFIDRIACAWLIRRFIDPDGRIKFVGDDNYPPLADELRFDMFEGEFTHIGDKCTFEVLVDSFALTSRPMTALAEIVHDIDLKDKKYGRPETAGIQAVFTGIAATRPNDQDRLERGSALLDEIYASLGGSTRKTRKE